MKTYIIVADGIVWEDADGQDEFTGYEADALAYELERRGYEVEVEPA